MATSGKHILVIEDDPDISDMLAMNLRDEGYAVETVGDGQAGLDLLQSRPYDLLILDLMLPNLNGLEICRAVRRGEHYQPIIIISSKASETQRVLGLELGADDYLTKPFSILELVARVRALFRRSAAMQSQSQAGGRIRAGELSIDPAAQQVLLAGRPVALTGKEYELLLFFARHPGKVFTRLALLDQVWGYNHEGYEHTVNSHINRLRGKIEPNPASPAYIQTVWGAGYRFQPPAPAAG